MPEFTVNRFKQLAGLLKESALEEQGAEIDTRADLPRWAKDMFGSAERFLQFLEENLPRNEREELKWRVEDLLRDLDSEPLAEKWEKGAKIEKTGEHAGKTVAQIRKRLATLKKKEDKSEAEKEEQDELVFALRAKTGWKKGTGATK